MKQHASHNIAFLGFERIQLLDLVGPLESFAISNEAIQGLPYRTFIIAEKSEFCSESNIRIKADYCLNEPDTMHNLSIDTLVIPGGAGARIPSISENLKQWVFDNFASINRIVTVCTGMFLIADHPYLQGKEVVTHWGFADLLQQTFPHLKVNRERLFIQQGKFYSAAGILSGIDLALNLIEKDHGVDVASFTAKYLVTYLRRSGHQSQFSEPLRFQANNNSHLERINRCLNDHHAQAYSLKHLAEQTHISERHLNRLIKCNFQMTAAKYVEHIKLEQSKIYLAKKNVSIDYAASMVGYTSADVFRRSFKRKYGIAPQSYQRRFQ